MSRHSDDPMMEVLEMIFGDRMNGRPREKESTPSEPPTETKGFESLVSVEEYEVIKGVKEAFENFIKVHNKNTISLISKGKLSPYAMLQYTFLSDTVNDAMEAIGMMYGIHTLDKEVLDEMAKDSGCDSIEEFEHKISRMLVMKKLIG